MVVNPEIFCGGKSIAFLMHHQFVFMYLKLEEDSAKDLKPNTQFVCKEFLVLVLFCDRLYINIYVYNEIR